MRRAILFVAIFIVTNLTFAQGPANHSNFAKAETINYISNFRKIVGEHSMKGAKIKVRSRITCFNFQAEKGEYAKVKRFKIQNGKFRLLDKSVLRIEKGDPFTPVSYTHLTLPTNREL